MRTVHVDMTSGEPTYLQLAAILRDGIEDGTWPAGSRLPSEHAMVRETGLSQSTVRRSVALLRGEGLVRVSPGRGLYVIAVPDPQG